MNCLEAARMVFAAQHHINPNRLLAIEDFNQANIEEMAQACLNPTDNSYRPVLANLITIERPLLIEWEEFLAKSCPN